jgi:hypothetical protein
MMSKEQLQKIIVDLTLQSRKYPKMKTVDVIYLLEEIINQNELKQL